MNRNLFGLTKDDKKKIRTYSVALLLMFTLYEEAKKRVDFFRVRMQLNTKDVNLKNGK